MKQFTIRGLPQELEKRVEKEAKKKGLSVNKVILSLLEKGAGYNKAKGPQTIYTDLDYLAGSWSLEEAQEIERYLRDQRQIDEELWK